MFLIPLFQLICKFCADSRNEDPPVDWEERARLLESDGERELGSVGCVQEENKRRHWNKWTHRRRARAAGGRERVSRLYGRPWRAAAGGTVGTLY
jgi:hypothetical protein